MGTLYYGAARTPIRVEDRILAHLKVLATSKLRRSEPFLLSWTDGAENDRGRNSVWLHPFADIHYKFDDPEPADIDPKLLEHMAVEATLGRGLILKDATLAHAANATPTSIEPSSS